MAGPEPGSFVHIEFASTDPVRTRKFFEDLFGWEFTPMPGLEYHVFATSLGPGGAVMRPEPGRPGGILNYLLSEDIDADVRRIEAAGGRILEAKKEIPNVGWWALFEDPTGLTLALFQSLSSDRGPVGRFRSAPARRAPARKARRRGGRRSK